MSEDERNRLRYQEIIAEDKDLIDEVKRLMGTYNELGLQIQKLETSGGAEWGSFRYWVRHYEIHGY